MEPQHSGTFITEGKPPPEELVEDDLADLQALVSGVTQTSQSTLLLKKRKQMREVDDALEFMKEEFDTRMAECDRAQMEFERKQVDMKKMVAQFEKFIMENDAKKRRAEIKANADVEQRVKLEAQIVQLQKREQELKNSTKKLQEELGTVRKYELYLDDVVKNSQEEYAEIGDVVNRHTTLQHAYNDLTNQSKKNHDQIEKKRLKLVQLRQEQQNKILVLNGDVASGQKMIEQLRVDCAQLDVEKESKERDTKEQTMEYGAVIMSIKNLYNRCQNSFVSTRPAVLREKGVPIVKYLDGCLDAMERRIVSLLEAQRSYPEWVAKGYTGEETVAPREGHGAPRPTSTERPARTGKPSKPHGARGRGSTTSSSVSNKSRLGRQASNSSGRFRKSPSGAGRSGRRRPSDASSVE